MKKFVKYNGIKSLINWFAQNLLPNIYFLVNLYKKGFAGVFILILFQVAQSANFLFYELSFRDCLCPTSPSPSLLWLVLSSARREMKLWRSVKHEARAQQVHWLIEWTNERMIDWLIDWLMTQDNLPPAPVSW